MCAKKKKVYKEVLRKEEVCQTCKNHRNKPSRCIAGQGKFVGRKDTPKALKCDNYGWNKRKLSTMELKDCKDCDGSCGCSNKNKMEETINA